MGKKAYLAFEKKDYEKLGVGQSPEPWEDGLRSSGKEGSFEWWYTDAEFDDGTKAVVIFYTKKMFDIDGPANPTVSFQLTLPDGAYYESVFSEGENSVIRASKECCDVAIGKNTIRFCNGNYEIHFEKDEVVYDCLMKPKVSMWRPGIGTNYFGENQENSFSWFVALPSAHTTATLQYKGETYELSGNGYHDHNWGDIPMQSILNHWYWCRGNIGDYTVISSDLIAEKKYDYNRIIHFMVAKDGAVIADDPSKVTVQRLDTETHPVTGKFMDNHLVFTYTDRDKKYILEYIRNHDIQAASLLDVMGLSPEQKRMAEKAGLNPTYVRIVGTVKLTVEEDGESSVFEKEGLWEQMFFGNNKEAVIGD